MPKRVKTRAAERPLKRDAKPAPKRANAAPKRGKPDVKRGAAAERAPQNAIDPRVLAAIGLALEDERVAAERSAALDAGASGWLALARTRGVRDR